MMTVALLLTALALAAADPPTQDSQSAKPATTDAAVSAVTVTGTRQQVETSIDRRSYSVAGDLQAQTGSIADVLRNIPSVQVDLQGNLTLRGDSATVLLDGKPSSQFSPDNLAQALQSLPANQIDRVEVMTNPSAEFRADGAGGIINLITKKAKGAGRTGSFRIQAATGPNAAISATGGYNSDRLSVIADASYRYDHTVGTVLVQQGLLNPTTGLIDDSQDRLYAPSAQDVAVGHLGADYDLSAQTRLSGSLRFTYTGLFGDSADAYTQDGDAAGPSIAFGRTTRQSILQYNGEASLILRHTYGPGNELTLNATYGGAQGVTRRTDDIAETQPAPSITAEAIFRNSFNRRSMFTADYVRPLGAAKLKLGYDFEYADHLNDYNGEVGTPGMLGPDPGQTDRFTDAETHHQAYATYERTAGKLDALIGLRAETTYLALNQVTQALRSSQDYTRLYPTLHLAWDLSGGKRLIASYSRRVVRPGSGDLNPFVNAMDVGKYFAGNPDLKPQETDSYELGFEHREGADSFLATVYYRQIHDAFALVVTDLGGGAVLQQIENLGRRANGGMEMVLANSLTPKLSYNLSADAYWSEISAANLGLAQGRSIVTGFGRANLNWQITPKDFLQLNIFANGKALQPQGYTAPTISGNIGYRHTINSKVAWMFVVQDPFHSLKSRLMLDAIGGGDRRTFQTNSRTASLALVWNFSGKPAAVNFDFAPGGYGP